MALKVYSTGSNRWFVDEGSRSRGSHGCLIEYGKYGNLTAV